MVICLGGLVRLHVRMCEVRSVSEIDDPHVTLIDEHIRRECGVQFRATVRAILEIIAHFLLDPGWSFRRRRYPRWPKVGNERSGHFGENYES